MGFRLGRDSLSLDDEDLDCASFILVRDLKGSGLLLYFGTRYCSLLPDTHLEENGRALSTDSDLPVLGVRS